MPEKDEPRSVTRSAQRRLEPPLPAASHGRGPVPSPTSQAVGEAAFHGVVEAAPDAILLTDRDGLIVLVNTQ
ncbi:MAG TPA: hypothetical protein VKU87_04325, partial [Thermomicrobiaceae bacterium]|nr:hypothetical protein [Thermomicrobiaceae bacterium]